MRFIKITLIYPRWRQGLWSILIYRMPPLGLYRLASLTPDDVEVEIIDENLTDIDFSPVDLVGISVMTPASSRAYEIAQRYREMGVKVILGGIHPSILPDEAALYADSVVIGEADDLWAQIISDFKHDKLQKRYIAERLPDITNSFTDAATRLHRGKYVIKNFLQTARGCPVNCKFCSVTTFNGARMRYRSIEDVTLEIDMRRPISRYFLFADDNLLANSERANKLFDAIMPLDISWGAQVTVKLGMEEALLKHAVRSGCRVVFIGFESINQYSLDFCTKRFKVEKYETAIKRLKDHGVFIIGSFIFGFDTDNADVIKRTIDFCLVNNIDMVQFSILTPFPGTGLYDDFTREGRITSFNWSKYDAFHVVFKPRLMTGEELQQNVNNAYKTYNSFSPAFRRVRETLKYGSWRLALLQAKTSWDSYSFDI